MRLARRLAVRGLMCAAVAGVLLGAALEKGQPFTTAQEYQIKAAFLYNFAKFVDWPGQANGPDIPIVIVVFGKDPFGQTLEQTVQGKTVNDRPLLIRHPRRVEDLQPCHILFVSASEKNRLPEILQSLGKASVLTVGEMDEFLRLGGMVNLVMEENKVRFEVNTGAARRMGLKISSKLLSLARVVRE